MVALGRTEVEIGKGGRVKIVSISIENLKTAIFLNFPEFINDFSEPRRNRYGQWVSEK